MATPQGIYFMKVKKNIVVLVTADPPPLCVDLVEYVKKLEKSPEHVGYKIMIKIPETVVVRFLMQLLENGYSLKTCEENADGDNQYVYTKHLSELMPMTTTESFGTPILREIYIMYDSNKESFLMLHSQGTCKLIAERIEEGKSRFDNLSEKYGIYPNQNARTGVLGLYDEKGKCNVLHEETRVSIIRHFEIADCSESRMSKHVSESQLRWIHRDTIENINNQDPSENDAKIAQIVEDSVKGLNQKKDEITLLFELKKEEHENMEFSDEKKKEMMKLEYKIFQSQKTMSFDSKWTSKMDTYMQVVNEDIADRRDGMIKSYQGMVIYDNLLFLKGDLAHMKNYLDIAT